MAPASTLTAHLAAEFNRRWGAVGESEVRSWRNSLTALAAVVDKSGVTQSGVGVEVRLPLTSKRLDASLVARSREGRPTVVLIELKQWTSVEPSANPDNVLVGGREILHPSIQAWAYADYLRDAHSAFTQEGFDLNPCAFLHNMEAAEAEVLRGHEYESAVRAAPLFASQDTAILGTFLAERLSGGDGMELLPAVVQGRYSPSRKLIDGIAQSLRDNPVWTLLDEQRVAFNVVRGAVERARLSGQKSSVIVLGGPGTGKSVIAAHLLVTLAEGGRPVVHATGSKAFTTNLRALGPRSSVAAFRYFNSFMHKTTEPDSLEVIICDEAHRLRETSNSRFTGRAQRSEISQVREIIRAAKVSVFFIDERQNVRPGEIGSVEAIEDGASEEQVPVETIQLTGQFRCGGSEGYIEWVDKLMSDQPEIAGRWYRDCEYELQAAPDPSSLERMVRAVQANGNTARLVAGFCWPWSDPNPDGTLVADVVIGGWERPWNEKSPEQCRPARAQPSAGRHPYTLWATEPDRIGEVGCIYSAQGFEFDYVGVILGNDLVWRGGTGWVGDKAPSFDQAIQRAGPGQLVSLLQHTYRVLLTRGMKGTFIHSTDPETQEMLQRSIGAAGSPQ